VTTRAPGRERLSTVLRATRGVITVDDVVSVLGIERRPAAQLLSRWTDQGWLKRIRHGTYAPLPLDATTTTKTIANPWLLVATLFEPGYVGGWSAAEHWELTEQMFRDVCVFTTTPFRSKRQEIEGTTFVMHMLGPELLFGTKPVWDAGRKIAVSDAHRTIIDMMARPETGGGIRHAADCLAAYLSSTHADALKLIQYAEHYGSGAVFKRMGFLLDELGGGEAIVDACRARLSTGYAKLDPALPRDRLVTKWRLWVPTSWKPAK
jgi:predicted transcriptional regulator of viral defense system